MTVHVGNPDARHCGVCKRRRVLLKGDGFTLRLCQVCDAAPIAHAKASRGIT